MHNARVRRRCDIPYDNHQGSNSAVHRLARAETVTMNTRLHEEIRWTEIRRCLVEMQYTGANYVAGVSHTTGCVALGFGKTPVTVNGPNCPMDPVLM